MVGNWLELMASCSLIECGVCNSETVEMLQNFAVTKALMDMAVHLKKKTTVTENLIGEDHTIGLVVNMLVSAMAVDCSFDFEAGWLAQGSVHILATGMLVVDNFGFEVVLL